MSEDLITIGVVVVRVNDEGDLEILASNSGGTRDWLFPGSTTLRPPQTGPTLRFGGEVYEGERKLSSQEASQMAAPTGKQIEEKEKELLREALPFYSQQTGLTLIHRWTSDEFTPPKVGVMETPWPNKFFIAVPQKIGLVGQVQEPRDVLPSPFVAKASRHLGCSVSNGAYLWRPAEEVLARIGAPSFVVRKYLAGALKGARTAQVLYNRPPEEKERVSAREWRAQQLRICSQAGGIGGPA